MYLVTNIVCVASIIVTRQSVFIGAVVMLLEADLVVEELTMIADDHLKSPAASDLAVVTLAAVGVTASLGVRVAVTLVVFTTACGSADPLMMDATALGTTCFSIVFYLAVAAFVIRRQACRLRQRWTSRRLSVRVGGDRRDPESLKTTAVATRGENGVDDWMKIEKTTVHGDLIDDDGSWTTTKRKTFGGAWRFMTATSRATTVRSFGVSRSRCVRPAIGDLDVFRRVVVRRRYGRPFAAAAAVSVTWNVPAALQARLSSTSPGTSNFSAGSKLDDTRIPDVDSFTSSKS